MLIRIVRMTFREDETEAFLTIFRNSHSKIQSFAGCRHVELLQDLDEPNVYSTYSLWDSDEYLDAYRRSELFRSIWKETKALFAAKPQAWSHRQVNIK